MLTSWAADGSLGAAAREALRLDGEHAQITALISPWATGAYAISTGTIYMNRDWLASASKARVIAAPTEELGHHLDGILHDQNSYGQTQVADQHLATDTSAIARSTKIPLLSARDARKAYLSSSKITTQCRNGAPVSWREACSRDRSIAYLLESKKTSLASRYHCKITHARARQNLRAPFFVWCISGSRSPALFLVGLGAAIKGASMIVPCFMAMPLALKGGLSPS